MDFNTKYNVVSNDHENMNSCRICGYGMDVYQNCHAFVKNLLSLLVT